MPPGDLEPSRLHYEMIRGLVEEGACPGNGELARRLDVPQSTVEHLLRELSNMHGVVLHPHVSEPWILHPFSLTPTINWIQGRRGGWWAPCVWCAFGVAGLVGGEVSIHSRYAAQTEPLVIRVRDGQPVVRTEVLIHFAIPPSHAWDNVHRHCALVLPFHSREETTRWCLAHKLPEGELVPLQQVAHLAQMWYGTHADRNWKKWTMAEAQEIFHRAGLEGAFWDLGGNTGRF